jgi:hypothetical protein
MKIIYKYRTVIAIVLPILILVLFRLLNPNNFKTDAGLRASPSIEHKNLVTRNNLLTLPGDKIIVILDKSEVEGIVGKTLKSSMDSVISRTNLKTLRKHRGPILLCSGDQTIAARTWMVLSQLGIRDLYILTDEVENEVMKYKFRPDTMTGPELNKAEL